MCVCVCMVASVAARRAAKGGNNFGRNKISSGRCCKAQQKKEAKKNTNHGKILLKRRVVERVAQWQLQLQPKGEGEGVAAEIENETGPAALPLPGTCRGDAILETRVYLWRIFDFRISYLVLPSSVPSPPSLSLSFPSRWQSSPCGIDILTAVLGELQQQKSLHKYLFIYARKSTLATRSAHKPPPPPWCRSGGARCSVQQVVPEFALPALR